MKIISKYKDYYDYLVHSKYGMDEGVILDRRTGFVFDETMPTDKGYHKIIKIAICDLMYSAVIDYKSNIHWLGSIVGLGGWENDYKGGRDYYVRTYPHFDKVDLKPMPTDINKKCNCPIVLVSGAKDQYINLYPSLSNLNISSILSPDDIYIKIYNWLLKQKDVHYVDNRSNMQKVEAHGFDKKKSFRHRK